MLIGVPKEIKVHEYRVGLTPGSVRDVAAHVIRTAERLSQELDQAPL